MSWSNFVWDANSPRLVVTLTTNNLVFDHFAENNQGNYQYDTGWACGDGIPCNPPTVKNTCNALAPQIVVFSDGLKTNSSHANSCCYKDVCTMSTNNTCTLNNLIQVCGMLNGPQTCSLGQAGTANATGLTQGTDWDIGYSKDWVSGNSQFESTVNQGWVRAVYGFDFSNYNMSQPPSNPFQLGNWLQGVCQGKSVSAPNGMDPIAATRIRDAHATYGILQEFFNQMYATGYYTNQPQARTIFLKTARFIEKGFAGYVSAVINGMLGQIESLYSSTAGAPQVLINALTQLLQPPHPIQQPNSVYQVSFQLNYLQYQAFVSSTDAAVYVSQLLASMLRDSQGTMTNLNEAGSWAPDDPRLDHITVDGITAIELWDSAAKPSYLVQSGIAVADWQSNWSTKYPNYMFATVQVTGTVTKWSPLLAVYFQVFLNASFDSATCQAIAAPVGSLHVATLPLTCFQSDCDQSAQLCKTEIEKYCAVNYVPPDYTSRDTTDYYLMGKYSNDCLCYASDLAPVSNPKPGNIGAMCFDNHCSAQTRQEFGITDTQCKDYCQEVWGWLNNQGADQSQNATHMDWLRFQQICGSNYRPYTPAAVNWSVAICGVVGTVLSAILLYALTRHRKYSSTKTKIVLVIAVGTLLAVTAFLSRDMAGLSSCGGGSQFECRSRYTHLKLPKQFCSYVLNCECQFDQDCPSGCLCASSTCVPETGKRGFETKTTRNWVLIIIWSLLCVLFFTAAGVLYHESHWKINKFWFIAGIATVGILPLVFLALKTTSEKVFTESCQKGGTCKTDQDCPTGGARCINGQCEALPAGCPVTNAVGPPDAGSTLPSGSYFIQSKARYLHLVPENGAPARLIPSTGNTGNTPLPIWVLDTVKNHLIAADMNQISCTLVPYDLCEAKNCTGIIYCQNMNTTIPVPQFFLTQNGSLYNVEAGAYLIPDTRPCASIPCAMGDCLSNSGFQYVTYTTDPVAAANQWIFTACDPTGTCHTSCGVCPPFMTCVHQNCQVAVYQLQVFFSADMTGSFDWVQLGNPYSSGSQYELKFTSTADPANFVASYLPATQQLTLWPQNDRSKQGWGLSYQCVTADCPNCCLYYSLDASTPVIIGPDNQLYLGSIADYTRLVGVAYSNQITLLGSGDPKNYIPLYFKFVLVAPSS